MSYIAAQLHYIAVLAMLTHCSNGTLLTADQAAMSYVSDGYASLYASLHGAS